MKIETMVQVLVLSIIVCAASKSFAADNRVLTLDGVNDSVVVPNSVQLVLPYLQDISLTTWFKFMGALPTTESAIFSFNDAYTLSYLGTGSGRLRLRFHGTGGTFLSTSNNWQVGRWYHFGFRWDTSTTNGTIYVDGNLNTSTTDWGRRYGSATNFYMGRFSWTAGGYMKGCIDDITLWEKKISDFELSQAMRKQLTGTESGLVAWWNFDDGTANDASTNHHNGTLQNGATTIVDNYLSLDIQTFFAQWAAAFSFNTTSGLTYRIQCTTNVMSTNWFDLPQTMEGTGGVMYMYDPLGFSPQRNYRIIQQ